MAYQSTPADVSRAYIIGAVYVALIVVVGIMIIRIWPPNPWPQSEARNNGLLDQLIRESGCKTPSPSPSATPSPTPQETPTATPAAAGNSGNTTAQPAPPAGTRPANAVAGQTRGQDSAGAQGNGQASGQPGTVTPPNTGGDKKSGASETTSEDSEQTKTSTKDRSGEIVIVPMKLYGDTCVATTFDMRLLLLVVFAGMLGAFVHGATSLADYIGNNGFNRSWTWFYVLRPGIGMALALVFYFVIRGGFLSTTGGANDINPYGIAALAGMVGMFSKQATDKLSEVFSTLFRSAGDAQRRDPLRANGATMLQIEPASVVAGGESFKLSVSGAGFIDGAVIAVDEEAQTTTFESDTKLSAQIAKETIATAKTLKITVVNKDQTKFGPVDLTVTAANGAVPPPPGGNPPPPGDEGEAVDAAAADAADEKPVDGEGGGDDDLIDGCEVDMKADTPDEDLPVTKGGMQ